MNPYSRVQALVARRRGDRWMAALPPVAAFAVTPLTLPLLGRIQDATGLEALSSRLGWLVAGVMVLHAYDLVVRGADRPILDLHPIQPVALLDALVRRAFLGRLSLPIGVAVATAPLALHHGEVAWAGLVGVVLSSYLGGVGVGFAVSLGGVWAAYSPALSGVLTLLAGSRPKMQTSLIYAPGVGLFGVGAATALAAAGARAGLAGWGLGWAWMAGPGLVGLMGYGLARVLAPAWYVRATALLGEIDAAHAGAATAAEARSVYLDWLARGWPELLRALRQGWRARRLWATGAWGLGLGLALAAWSKEGLERGPALGLAVAVLYGALPGRLAAGDPLWLDEALGVPRGQVAAARGVTACLYGLGAAIPLGLALGLRHGFAAALPRLALVVGVGAVGAALGALLTLPLRERASAAYAPLGLILLLLAWRLP